MFSTRLKTIRKECNLTQKDVYEKINMSANGYASYEQGRTEPTIDTLIKLANVFNCTVDYIVGRENENGAIILQNSPKSQIEEIYEKLNRQNKIKALGYLTGLLDAQ